MNEALRHQRYEFVTERKRRQLLKEHGLRLEVGRNGVYRPGERTAWEIVCDTIRDGFGGIPSVLRRVIRAARAVDHALFGDDPAVKYPTYVCGILAVLVVVTLILSQVFRSGSSP